MKHILNKTVAYTLAVAMALASWPALTLAYAAAVEPEAAVVTEEEFPAVTVEAPAEDTESVTVEDPAADAEEPEAEPETPAKEVAQPKPEQDTEPVPVAEPEESPTLFGGGYKPENFAVQYTPGESKAYFTWTNPSGLPIGPYDTRGIVVYAHEENQPVGVWERVAQTGTDGTSWTNRKLESSPLEHRKSYVFQAYYYKGYDYDNMIDGGALATTDTPITCTIQSELEQEKKAEIAAASKKMGTYTYTNYDEKGIMKGSKAELNRGLYKLTIQVTKIAGTEITVKGTIKNKFPEQLQMYCDLVSWIKSSGSKSSSTGVTTKNGVFTYIANLNDMALGCNYLKFGLEVNGGIYGEYDTSESLYFNVVPGTYNLSLKDATAIKNKITLFKAFGGDSNTIASGTTVWYKKKSAKKWTKKTFPKGKTISFSKLSANTMYQFKMQNYIKSKKKGGVNDKGKTITNKSATSKTLSVKTAMAKAPAIKSIKVNSVKTGKSWVKGYWDSNYKWHKGYWNTTTTYKMTVTLKSNGTKGLIVTNSDRAVKGNRYFKGSGKKITVSGTYNGNYKGKKIKMKFATCNDYSDYYATGISPYITKTIKLK